ncbi:MAG TPA: aromatic ring-hydroxylating dioxygenase subunit alpha [Terriglobales bacterium]|nr:aromatic ring-hydroxylating dioxygenase subunit alpha [Terriglobales bacterium]
MHPDHDIARASTLVAARYFAPETLSEEKKRIFSSCWQLVGHVHQLANPGDYFTFDLQGEPLLVVRGDDGALRGFFNVCRHRAGNPASGCGNRRIFRCGYHGWTYRLDGALLVTPEFDGVEDFDPQEFGLVPVRVAEWFNLVFVNLDPEAPPFMEHLGELPAQAEKFDFRRMKFFERRTYDMKCNWKTYIDNYLEGYHLPSVHPGLNRELNYSAYTVEACAQYVRQWSPIRGAQPGDETPRRYHQASDDLTADYFWVFPNWMLNCYPDNVSINMILPIDAERTLAIFEWYLPEEHLNREAARKSVEFSHEIQIEDVSICEIVQKNLHSRSYHSGRYSVKQEKGVHAFHRMYRELMPGN